MIDFGWSTSELECPPWVCGAYMEVVADDEDALHIHEMREQFMAQALELV